ncbi:hypothetical protein RQP46_002587 [Phenoliferia psychrophenolica]
MDDEEEETRKLLGVPSSPSITSDKDGFDTDSDSDSDDESPPARRARPSPTLSSLDKLIAKIYPPSPLTKNVIKCVIAYALAELFTFVPALSALVGAPFDVDGPVRNAHVIATVAVYFNPAKTIGSMLEANLFMLIGLLYAVFLCCGSMAMTVLLDTHGDHHVLAHAIVLILWLGGGFGLLAFVKVRVNKGAFHVGEFQSQAIQQVVIIVIIGTLISNIVCFAIWPGSATSKLQVDLNKTLNSFSTLLEMLTKTFLLDEDITTRPESLKKAIDAHQSSFTTLKSSLEQAKYEVLDSRIRLTTHAYDAVVESMTRLAQGLTGLRSGLTLQYDLMRAQREGKFEDQHDGLDMKGSAEKRALMDELVVFEQFRERVGKSLQQLSWTSKRTLALLRTSFVNTKAGSATLEALRSDDAEAALSSDALLSLKDELEQSLVIFKRSHSQAIKILYQRLPAHAGTPAPHESGPDDDGPNDNLFRIYYFCFNLEGWVRELACLVDTFVEIRSTEESVARRQIEVRKRWGVFSFIPNFWNLLVKLIRPKPTSADHPFPEIVDGALSSHQLPASQLGFLGRLKRGFWHFGWHLKQPNVLFSIKTGTGVSILASAAFIPSLRPIWIEWRGEWALISYMVVMAPTIGATNFLAFGRVVGTVAGAAAAVAFYLAFPGNPVMLPLLGAIFSIPCFYVIITRPQYAPSSRFVLLTFNLTCLYSFNLREEDTHVVAVAYHRAIAVGFGVLWGLFINSYIWPLEARRELRKGLSEYFLNAAYLYERLVRTYSSPAPSLAKLSRRVALNDSEVGESTALLPPEAKEDLEDAVEDFINMELYLQRSLIKDLMTSMRTVTTRDAFYTTVRRDFVIPVNKERREMVGNVLLYLSILSSAANLKTPLPAYLPPAAEARDRLVKRLRQLPVDVIAQLDALGEQFQRLFGIIGGASSTEAFEALFVDHGEAPESDEDA